jgi:hypothetical protein
MQTYHIEHSISDLKKAVAFGFITMESHDEIVGSVYVMPATAKKLILAMSEDIKFDFIPEGIGMIRTAYLKFMPSVKDNEIRFINLDKTVEIKLYLI